MRFVSVEFAKSHVFSPYFSAANGPVSGIKIVRQSNGQAIKALANNCFNHNWLNKILNYCIYSSAFIDNMYI